VGRIYPKVQSIFFCIDLFCSFVGRIYPKVQFILCSINLLCVLVGRTYPNGQLFFSRINLLSTFVGKIYPKVQSTTVHNLLVCAHTLFMNYITKTIIYCLFPTIANNNNYFFCARSRQKPTSETISAFANIFLSLTFLKHIEVVLNLTAVRLYEYVVDKLS